MPNRTNHSFRRLSLHKLTSSWRPPEYQLKPYLGQPNPSLFLPFFSLPSLFFIIYLKFWTQVWVGSHFFQGIRVISVICLPLLRFWFPNVVQVEGIFRSIRYIRIGSLSSTRVKLPHHEYCSTQSMTERALWTFVCWRSDYTL